MRIDNNQRNVAFEKNVVVHFVTNPKGDMREIAKEFAVTQGKIDSVDNVGLALYVDSTRILVLDKTVEISKSLKTAFYKVVKTGDEVRNYYKKHGNQVADAIIKGLKDTKRQLEQEYNMLRQQIANSTETDPISYIG